jgi:hypothetical protein
MMALNSLQDEIKSVESFLPHLKAQRASTAFDNDMFEALTYWSDLGSRAVNGDARVNYPARAREELALVAKFTEMVRKLPLEARPKYLDMLTASRELLMRLEAIQPEEDGYLGTLSAIRAGFGFLQSDYDFRAVKTEPTGIRYSSGSVYIELQYSIDPSLSCSYGPESEEEISFWIEDLLFLAKDERYRTFQKQKTPLTKEEVHAWFTYLANIWKQHGRDVLANRPGIFVRLAEAQRIRDAEYAVAASRQSGLRE